MWKHYKSISFGLLALASFASAQGGLPTSGVTPMPQAAQASASAPAGGMFESKTFLEMANRVFDPSSDSLDFENGSFEWKGRTSTSQNNALSALVSSASFSPHRLKKRRNTRS